MRSQPIRPSVLYQGVPYDYAAIAPDSRLVFTAGACPLDMQGCVVAPGDYEAQARQALDNLLVALAAADSGPEQILKTTIYVVASERAELARVWNVIAEGLGAARPPSTLLGVALLGYPEQLVEIEAVALSGAAAEAPGSSAGSEPVNP
jgi:enamine deaminase RidA (YjgF/YER057c/UK114 family)